MRRHYYKTIVGQDQIPDPFSWLDKAIPWAIIGLALVILGSVGLVVLI